jgi:hypothetical protein
MLAVSLVPPNEALLSKPIQHSHCNAMVEREDACSAPFDGWHQDLIVDELVDFYDIGRANLRMNEVVKIVLGLCKQVGEDFLRGRIERPFLKELDEHLLLFECDKNLVFAIARLELGFQSINAVGSATCLKVRQCFDCVADLLVFLYLKLKLDKKLFDDSRWSRRGVMMVCLVLVPSDNVTLRGRSILSDLKVI